MVTSLDVKLLAEVCQKPWNDAYRYGLFYLKNFRLKSQIIQVCFKYLMLSNVGTFFFPAGRPNSQSVSPSGQKPCQIFLSPAWLDLVGTRPVLDQNLCASKTASPLKSTEASKFPWDQQDQPPPLRMKMDDSEPLLAHIGDKIAMLNCEKK